MIGQHFAEKRKYTGYNLTESVSYFSNRKYLKGANATGIYLAMIGWNFKYKYLDWGQYLIDHQDEVLAEIDRQLVARKALSEIVNHYTKWHKQGMTLTPTELFELAVADKERLGYSEEVEYLLANRAETIGKLAERQALLATGGIKPAKAYPIN